MITSNKTRQNTYEEKAKHFAEIGVVHYASLYATLALLEEVKELKHILLNNDKEKTTYE